MPRISQTPQVEDADVLQPKKPPNASGHMTQGTKEPVMNRRVISANPYLPDGEATQTSEGDSGDGITLLFDLVLPKGNPESGTTM